jgi:hypothetical protein
VHQETPFVAWVLCRLFLRPEASLELQPALSPSQAMQFVTVWAMHAGLYLGLGVGTVRARCTAPPLLEPNLNRLLENSHEATDLVASCASAGSRQLNP